MDIDKSLYMKEFLELRKVLGTVDYQPAKNILYTNLYDQYMPREKKTKVKETVDEIEEKTIQILGKKEKGELPKNEDISLFDNADETTDEITDETTDGIVTEIPMIVDDVVDDDDDDDDEGEDDNTDEKSIPIEKEVPDVDILGGGHELKKIVINPNYVAADK